MIRLSSPRRSIAAAATAVALAGVTLRADPALAQQAAPAPSAPAPAPAPSPEKPANTATDAAKDYTQKMTSDDPASAVRTYWDMDAMLSGIFGEHLRRHSDQERAEMKKLLLTFIEQVYASPAIAAAMKQSTFADFQERPGPSAGTAAVAFNVLIQDKKLPNTLHMKAVEGKWKIFDAGTGGRMMVSAIRSQYEPQARNVTPLAYIQAMLNEAPGRKKEKAPGQAAPPSGQQEREAGQSGNP